MGRPRTSHRTKDGVEEKFCYRCRSYKPLNQFYNTSARQRWNGKIDECRQCRKEMHVDDYKHQLATLRALKHRREEKQ